MTEEAYNKKLADLQQYVPFMENMIAQLKDPKWKPREAQLNKMESLYSMITDKNKKWKFETLLKCEEVILKLQTKIKKSLVTTPQENLTQQILPGSSKIVPTAVVNEIMNVLKLNTARAKLHRMQESNETPKSPSPTPEISQAEPPKIIPIEPQENYKYRNIIDPNEFSSTWDNNLERYTKEKPDIYSSAAQSLTKTSKSKGKSVFERLGPVMPQKPLLTDDDLAELGTDDLYLQSSSTDSKQKDSLNIELNLKITPRIVPVPSSKPKITLKNNDKIEKIDKNRDKLILKDKDVKIKTVKVDGNVSGDVFGSLLSSIDTKIIEETKKKDHKKDSHCKHNDKDYKHKDREKKDHKHHHHHSKKYKDSDKDKINKEKTFPLNIDKTNEKEKSTEKSEKNFDVRKDEKTQEDYVSSTVDIPMDGNRPRRLADKYHPKPRLKQPQEEVGSTSRIEEKEEVKVNRDPRRRSPPFSASYFNQGSATNSTGFDSMGRDLGWGKYSGHVGGDVHVQQQGVGRFDPRFHQGYSATNTGYNQDVVCNTQLGLLPTPQNVSHLRSPQQHQNPPQFHPPPHLQSSQQYQNPQHIQPPRFEPPRFEHYDHHHQRPRTPFNERPRSESTTPFFQPPPVQSPLLPTPNQPPQPQFTPRKTFNPFEPLDAEKEKEEDPFNKRDFNYSRFGAERNRSKFRNERNTFDRRFDPRRDRFNAKTPRRSLDEDEYKSNNITIKTERVEETFTSPLEALYSTPKPVLSATQAKAALDKFKIPKKKHEEKKVEEIKEKVKEDVSDEDEDTPLSRKIKRRLRIRIDDDSEESEGERRGGKNEGVQDDVKKDVKKDVHKEVLKEEHKEVQKDVLKDVEKDLQKDVLKDVEKDLQKDVLKDVQKDDQNDGQKVVQKDVQKGVQKDVQKEIQKEVEKVVVEEEKVERSTRRLRSRTSKVEIVREEEKKVSPQRRSQRVQKKNLKYSFSPERQIVDKKEIISKVVPQKQSISNESLISNKEMSEVAKMSQKEIKIPKEELPQNEDSNKIDEISESKQTLNIKTDDESLPEKEKVKNELLADIKKNHLKMEETDVLQFILENYKKIKKILKSDSSSEDESESKKKKDIKKIEPPEESSSNSKNTPPKQLELEIVKNEDKPKPDDDVELVNEYVYKGEESDEESVPKTPKLKQKRVVKRQNRIAAMKSRKNPVKKVIVKRKGVNKRIGMNTRTGKLVKAKKARRSELDKLHDDIKEMLMGNEIMTVGGKRTCTIVKDDEKEKVDEKDDDESDDTNTEIDVETHEEIASKSNLKVLVEKTDLAKLLLKDDQVDEPEEIIEKKEPEQDEKHDLSPPILEKMVATPVADDQKRRIYKRKSIWASGIIKKRARRRLYKPGETKDEEEDEGEEEEEDEITEITEHDKKYFFLNASKIGCKLCPFKGKLIVQHYRTAHPESEVLISRVDQGVAETLIDDSIKNKEKYDNYKSSNKKIKFTFKCPFCFVVVKDTSNWFYNHLTSHTGEYRYGCFHCPYRTFNASNVRTHICQLHPKLHRNSKFKNLKIFYPEPDFGKYVYGHLCSECNFIQMIRGTVEEHAMVYHPGTPEIYRVNMSCLTEEKPPEDDEEQNFLMKKEVKAKKNIKVVKIYPASSSNLDDCINAVAAGAGEIKNNRIPEVPIEAEVKELSISELLSKMDEEESDDEVKKPIELAAFMCDTDLDIEAGVGDEKRETMKWINENTRKTRTSIADKLQSKLVGEVNDEVNNEDEMMMDLECTNRECFDDEITDEANKNVTINKDSIKTKELDPIDINVPENLTIEENSIQMETTLIPPKEPEKVHIKKVIDIPSTSSFKIDVMPQKKENISVSNIINRLQEKLTNIPSEEAPPEPKESISLSSAFKNTLVVGPICVIKKNGIFTYVCKVPHCKYSTLSDNLFSRHCQIRHKTYVYVFNTGKCDVCSIKFEYDGEFVSVNDVFNHVVTAHKDFFKSDPVNFKLPHDVPNVLSQGSDCAGPKFPFVITNVTSLAMKNRVLSPPPLIPLVKDSTEENNSDDNGETNKTKMPIISMVQSLAKPTQQIKLKQQQQPPPQKVISPGKIILRDIPLTEDEKHNKKSLSVLKKMLNIEYLNLFYKCPQYDCSFSTMTPIDFQRHFTQKHFSLNNVLVPCLYCDYKVLGSFYVVHLEVRHGQSRFACGDCFYRATCAYFVALHREMEHPNCEQNVYHLRPLKITNKSANGELGYPRIEEVILNYTCNEDASLNCSYKSPFFDEFLKHLKESHQSVQEEKSILDHWLTKDIGPFQCRYCKKATVTYKEMGRHQTTNHPQKACCFFYRKFLPSENVTRPDQIFASNQPITNNLIQLPEQAHLCTSKQNDSTEITVKDAEADSETFPELEPLQLSPNRVESKKDKLEDQEIFAIDDYLNLLDESDPLCLEDSLKEDEGDDKMPSAELTGLALYKCNCGNAYETMALLKPHIFNCVTKPYLCAHCGKERRSILGLLQHYREHGRKRFKCSLCLFKHWQQESVRVHMRNIHSVNCAIVLPAMFSGRKADPDSDDFVLRPRQTARNINDINLKLSNVTTELNPNNLVLKLTFGPGDIAKLPRQPIYPQPVKCAICDYETKVKTNMERHLQMHATQNEVPESAPVNPVPCLDKNEKMFDKMVNLASSSHVGGRMGGTLVIKVNIPQFIPVSNRFVCGAENCHYQCLDEGMLRRHILAFHGNETSYKCVHCNVFLIEDKTINVNVDVVLKHMKLHDSHLYKCSVCEFTHNLRHKIERHLSDKHSDKPQNLIVVREIKESNLDENLAEKDRPFRCGFCKFRCGDLAEIKNHVENKHNIDLKYKCALCPVGSDDVESFTSHFMVNHEGQAVDFIVSYYKEGEAKSAVQNEDFNTTPLWQRNNKTVKHIRGILLEETTPLSRKKLVKRKSNDDLEEIVKKKRLKKDEEVIQIEDENKGDENKGVEKKGVEGELKDKLKDNLKEIIGGKVEKKPIRSTRSGKNKNCEVETIDLDEINLDSSLKTYSKKKDSDSSQTESNLGQIENNLTENENNLDKNQEEDQTESDSEYRLQIDENRLEIIDLDSPKQINKVKRNPKRQIQPLKKPQLKKNNPQTKSVIPIIDLEEEKAPIQLESSELSIEDIENMSKTDLIKGNKIGTYGPYGTPWEGKFKCPLCDKCISSVEFEFKSHLYEELQCAPFKCSLCEFSGTSQESVLTHFRIEHNEIEKNDEVVLRKIDEQIENWVKISVKVQAEILKHDELKAMEEDKYLCLFCSYRSDKSTLRWKHISRHFIEKSYTCNHCKFGALTLQSFKLHSRNAESCKNLEESMSSLDLSNGLLVTHYLKHAKKIVESTYKEEEKMKIKCYYCDFLGTVDEHTEHSKQQHPEEIPRIYRYRCNICFEPFVSMVTVNHHFFLKHSGNDVNISMLSDDKRNMAEVKHVCDECKENFVSETEVVSHQFKHERLIFNCVYCPQRFTTWRKVVSHIELRHANKSVVFRFMEPSIMENLDGFLRSDDKKRRGRRKTIDAKKDLADKNDDLTIREVSKPTNNSSVLFIDDV